MEIILRAVLLVIFLILRGITMPAAVLQASNKFGISQDTIKKYLKKKLMKL